LLDGVLARDEQVVLSRHLDTCESCQQTLEELAAGDRPWTKAARWMGRQWGRIDPALQEAMQVLKGEGGQTEAQAEVASGDDESLSFLSPPDKPGQLGRLDQYEVLEVIGHGGMGLVLKAFDPGLHRFVAIKVLAPQLAVSAAARKRFAREARAAAAVSHEHVVAIHAVAEAAGLPYLVMAYVPGLSLQDKLDQNGPLEVKQVLRIGMQTAAGLAAAHAQGLIHRDIKPANILLENGVERVKLTDFGLARAFDDASLTQSGVVAGTPQYMAPEQAGGDTLDHRADLFSLGSVLYAACTGRPPFRASTVMAVLKRVCEETPRPIREVNPDIPEQVAEVIATLHAKDPAQRYQSAAEVAEILGQHLAHLQQPTQVPMPVRPGQPRVNQRELRPLGLHLAKEALLLFPRLGLWVVLFVWWLVGHVLWRLGKGLVWVLATLSWPVRWVFGKVVGGSRRLTVWLRPGAPADVDAALGPRPVRRWVVEVGSLLLLIAGVALVLYWVRRDNDAHLWPAATWADADGHAGPVFAVAFSPDGLLLATGSYDGTVKLRDPIRGQEQLTLEHQGLVWAMAFAPDSQTLAVGSSHPSQVKLWDLVPGKEPAAPHPGGRTVRLPNDRRMWAAERDTLRPGGRSLAYAPDGRTLALNQWGLGIRLWDVARGQERAVFQHGTGTTALTLAYAPDGRTLATGGQDGTVKLWDTATGQERHRFPAHRGAIYGLAFSPDSRRLASGGADRAVKVWDAATGDLRTTHAGHTGLITSLAFAPDGQTLASGSADRTVRLWDMVLGRRLIILPGHPHLVLSVAFAPDSQTLASGAGDGTVKLWEVATGHELATRRGQRTDVTLERVWVSPDGKELSTGAPNAPWE
jgi:WD40 repeat protein